MRWYTWRRASHVLVMGCEVSITVQEQDLEAVLDSFVKADWFFVAVKKANQILEMRKGNLENWTENIITPLCKFSHAVTLSTVCTSDLISQKMLEWRCFRKGQSQSDQGFGMVSVRKKRLSGPGLFSSRLLGAEGLQNHEWRAWTGISHSFFFQYTIGCN